MPRKDINELLQVLKDKTIDTIKYTAFPGADHGITIICTDSTKLEIQWNDNEGSCTINDKDI
jgi:hypothetical protein